MWIVVHEDDGLMYSGSRVVRVHMHADPEKATIH